MIRKIIDTSKTLREIHDTSVEVRLVDPRLLENALRAEGLHVEVEEIERPSFLLPTPRKELLNRLRSEVRNPALSETTRKQKIPLKEEDWNVLVDIADKFKANNLSVSPEQIASAALHCFLSDNNFLNKLCDEIAGDCKFPDTLDGLKLIRFLTAEEIHFAHIQIEELSLRSTPSKVTRIKELEIDLVPVDNLPGWAVGRQVVIKQVCDTEWGIAYSARIKPPLSEDDESEGRLMILIKDSMGYESKVELTAGEFIQMFEINETFSDKLDGLAIYTEK